jgi:hypothetical protein
MADVSGPGFRLTKIARLALRFAAHGVQRLLPLDVDLYLRLTICGERRQIWRNVALQIKSEP